jgi:hypothetical protein
MKNPKNHNEPNAIDCRAITYPFDFVVVVVLDLAFHTVDGALVGAIDELQGPFLLESYPKLLASHELQSLDRNTFQDPVGQEP